MSEQEFEVYLRLIAKLLRLSDAQREAISDELRDHMEARLDELMDAGMEREQAIHAAIEEFGDAAGLADEFTRITRHTTLRRRIMKTSIGALAAAAAIALAFLYMLPHDRAGVSGPADTFAQGAGVSEEALVTSTQESASTLERLSQRVTIDYNEAPLGEVFDHLRDATGVNIFVNWTVLEGAGIDKQHPVTLSLRDTSAHTVLSLMFQLFNPTLSEPIDYAVMDDVVVVATASEINDMRVVRIYDCLDLIQGSGWSRAQQREQQAPGQPPAPGTAPGMYGGEGEMRSYGGAMGGEEKEQAQAQRIREGVMAGGYRPTRGRGAGSYGGGYGGYSGYGGEGGYGMGGEMFASHDVPTAQQHANELIGVVNTLLDDGGSVSFYDGMLVVIAGHKSHQRIQETLTLMRKAQEHRQ